MSGRTLTVRMSRRRGRAASRLPGVALGLVLCAWLLVGCGDGCGGDSEERHDPPPPPGFPQAVRSPQPVGEAGDWAQVAAEYRDTCGIRQDGSLWCWGRNTTGQLGDGTTEWRGTPTRVGDATDWAAVEPGDHFTCARRRDGSVACWGSHENGVPGRGDAITNRTPTPIDLAPEGGAAPRLVELSIGDGHLCGLDDAGAAWCWGKPGVLGDGEDEWSPRPRRVDVSGIQPAPRFVALATGTHHTCALADDGRILCWGREDRGQLGDGGGLDERLRPVPIDLSGVTGARAFEALSASTYHTCAIARDGRPYCWGANDEGQLGTGDRADRRAPTPVDTSALPPDARLRRIECGYAHTCALDEAGRAWCWGENGMGPLGAPAVRDRSLVPVAVDGTGRGAGTGASGGADVRFRQISAGVGHTCGVTTEGRLLCWGRGDDGQLGLGAGPADAP